MSELKLPQGIGITNFKKLTNMYIYNTKYECNELDGIYLLKSVMENTGKKDANGDPIKKKVFIRNNRICDCISFVGKFYDFENKISYSRYQFKNMNTKKIDYITFKDGTKNADMIETLKNVGFSIDKDTLFTEFIQSLISVRSQIINYNEDCDYLDAGRAATRYAFPLVNNSYDYTHFITNNEIIEDSDFTNLDNPLFKTIGTFEGWKKDMQIIYNNIKEPELLKIILSQTLVGIILSFVGFKVECPVYAFAGTSQCGKGMLASIQAGVWQNTILNGFGVLRSSDDSKCGSSIINDRLFMLPNLTTEIQDLIDECGNIQQVAVMLYNHAKGTTGAKATEKGKMRNNVRMWRNPWVVYLERNEFKNVTGGKQSRILLTEKVYNKLENGRSSTIMIGDDNSKFEKNTTSNMGWAGMEFVNAIVKYNNENPDAIKNRYDDIVIEIQNNTNLKEIKKAQSAALIMLAHELAIKLDIFPQWGELTLEEIDKTYGENAVVREAEDIIMEEVVRRIYTDNTSYPFADKGPTTQEEYDSRSDRDKVRGRKKLLKDKGLCVAVMPEALLQSAINFVKTDLGYNYNYNADSIHRKYCLKKSDGKYTSAERNITYKYESGKARERCITVILYDMNKIDDEENKIKELIEEMK